MFHRLWKSQSLMTIRWTVVSMTYMMHSCRGTYVSSSVIGLLPSILDTVISAIRAYAVRNRGLMWAATVFATSMFAVIVSVYNIATTQFQVVDVDGTWLCYTMVQTEGSTAEKVFIVSSMFSILSQAIVAGLTWSRMLFLVRRLGKGQARVNPRLYGISWFFLRDGAVYFIAILTLQLVNCLLSYLTDVWFFDTVSQSILIVLLSRLLLNLRQASIRDVNPDESGSTISHMLGDLTHISSIAFEPRPGAGAAAHAPCGNTEEYEMDTMNDLGNDADDTDQANVYGDTDIQEEQR
ncbi:uncharacterized protein B0H18DRAFT_1019460, partial [Fomitopsis serialis]|uniref:uncharacterized protein n=1 Tax=Fomitopsis serialis TaxID=139415 RepID=UPI0020076DDE